MGTISTGPPEAAMRSDPAIGAPAGSDNASAVIAAAKIRCCVTRLASPLFPYAGKFTAKRTSHQYGRQYDPLADFIGNFPAVCLEPGACRLRKCALGVTLP